MSTARGGPRSSGRICTFWRAGAGLSRWVRTGPLPAYAGRWGSGPDRDQATTRSATRIFRYDHWCDTREACQWTARGRRAV